MYCPIICSLCSISPDLHSELVQESNNLFKIVKIFRYNNGSAILTCTGSGRLVCQGCIQCTFWAAWGLPRGKEKLFFLPGKEPLQSQWGYSTQICVTSLAQHRTSPGFLGTGLVPRHKFQIMSLFPTPHLPAHSPARCPLSLP